MRACRFVLIVTVAVIACASSAEAVGQDVEQLSLLTTLVRIPLGLNAAGQQVVRQGTGFFFQYEYEGGVAVTFLVTNLHVLTGSAPGSTNPPLGRQILFLCHTDLDKPASVQIVQFPLYTSENKPTWIGPDAVDGPDVALIPLASEIIEPCKLVVAVEANAVSDLWLRPASAVTVIGYPRGVYDTTNNLPIWKAGNVATEPAVDFEGKRLFLVDVSAYGGMSGSPVWAIRHEMYQRRDGNINIGTGVMVLLGIYAANVTPPPSGESIELGVVWKAQTFIDVAASFSIKEYEQEILSKLR